MKNLTNVLFYFNHNCAVNVKLFIRFSIIQVGNKTHTSENKKNAIPYLEY